MSVAKPQRGARVQRGHPLARGLVGFWAFNEGPSSPYVYDLSGNDNHGTLTNMDPETDWAEGGCLLSDANAGHMALEKMGSLPIGSENRTVAARWKTSDTGLITDSNAIIGWGNDVNDGQEFWVSVEDNELSVRVDNGSRLWTANGAANGDWHIGAWTLDGDNTSDMVCYMDGVLLAVASTAARTLNTASVNPVIGRRPAQDVFRFDGVIDCISVLDRALSASAVSELYHDPWAVLRAPTRTWFLPPIVGGYPIRLVSYGGLVGPGGLTAASGLVA